MLTAHIDVPSGQPDATAFRIVLRVMNQSERAISVLNPDLGNPTADMDWPWSLETFRISMLISFRRLAISVADDEGRAQPQAAIQTWATPVLPPKLELAPGASFEVPIPIGDFYELEPGKTYTIAIEYGDPDGKVAAHAVVTVP